MAQMRFEMKLAGVERKWIAGILAEALDAHAEYRGAPDFQYEVGRWLLTKDNTLCSPPIDHAVTSRELELVLRVMAAADVKTEGRMAVVLDGLGDQQATNLSTILISKANLLYHAFRFEEDCSFEVKDGHACLAFFEVTLDTAQVRAYLLFGVKLMEFAERLTRVTGKERRTDNDRYAFRCFLIRLGFIGGEYKQARKLLMQNLEGNGSWRSGHAPKTGVSAPKHKKDEDSADGL